MEHIVAVIDLGSNSVRMSISEILSDGASRQIDGRRETVRLAEGMKADGLLKQKPMERVIAALSEFAQIARSYPCSTIVAVATAAVRDAGNRDKFIEDAKKATGLDFFVLSGEQEAYYSYWAARQSCDLKDALVFDTGGGSTELALMRGKELVRSATVPCGAVVLTEKFSRLPQSALYRYTAIQLGAVDWLDEAFGLPLCGIGGSARCLVSLAKGRELPRGEIHNMKISDSAVNRVYKKLCFTPREKRAAIAGMDVSRADVILAGLTPMKVLLDMLSGGSVTVNANGVKEGVFFRIKEDILRKERERAPT